VHLVLSNGAVTIMDVKGDQFMVNGQRLKVYYEPDVVPLHQVDVFTMEEARTSGLGRKTMHGFL
jgi:hypothetical protein